VLLSQRKQDNDQLLIREKEQLLEGERRKIEGIRIPTLSFYDIFFNYFVTS
jgi:hypothetical protein